MLILENSEDCHADNARLALPEISDTALMNLAGACIREVKRREYIKIDNAKLTDVQAIIDAWE